MYPLTPETFRQISHFDLGISISLFNLNELVRGADESLSLSLPFVMTLAYTLMLELVKS